MKETEIIINALANVTELATNSDYYSKKRYGRDIALIASIVEKEIPKKPESESESFVDENNVKITITRFFCPNCVVGIGPRENYCINCGQRLDWRNKE